LAFYFHILRSCFLLLSISHLYLDKTVPLKRRTVRPTVMTFPTSYAARNLINVFIRTSHLTLFCADKPSSQTTTTPLTHVKVRPDLISTQTNHRLRLFLFKPIISRCYKTFQVKCNINRIPQTTYTTQLGLDDSMPGENKTLTSLMKVGIK